MAGIAVDVAEILVTVSLRPAGDILPDLDEQHHLDRGVSP